MTSEGSVGDTLHLDNWYDSATATHVQGWREIMTEARRANLRFWFSPLYGTDELAFIQPGGKYAKSWNDMTYKHLRFSRQLVNLWGGQAVCDIAISARWGSDKGPIEGMLPVPELDSLLSTGCFLITNDVGYIQSHRDKDDFARIGIPTDPKFVETLLDQGFKEQEVGQLLFLNLQRTLQKWWADPNYSHPKE